MAYRRVGGYDVKKIRKKKVAPRRKPPVDEGAPEFLKGVERFVKERTRYAAVLGVVVLFAVIFVLVYFHYSRRREAQAVRQVEQALASETVETQIPLLEDVLEEYAGTLPAARALYYLGDAYYESGKYESARQCYERYLQSYPRGEFAPNAAEGIAYCAESEGKFDEAIEQYSTLLETYGDSYVAQHAWYNIGKCYELTGDQAGAAHSYENQVSLYPMSAWSDKAEARLGELRYALPSSQVGHDGDAVPLMPDIAETPGAG
jgi:tetratricopeptide (TPR) repeat protein